MTRPRSAARAIALARPTADPRWMLWGAATAAAAAALSLLAR